MQISYPFYKHALITPYIAKVNLANDIENYFRQISVLLQLAKVLEKIQLQLNLQDRMVERQPTHVSSWPLYCFRAIFNLPKMVRCNWQQ